MRLVAAVLLTMMFALDVSAQVLGEAVIHRRGRLWEEVWNSGLIGDLGAWDYQTSAPLGLYPGFDDYSHPVGGETNAIGTFANANFHNFRSGVWIVAKDVSVPGLPPGNEPKNEPYEVYYSGLQGGNYGIETVRTPTVSRQNYLEEDDFNPLLPEEMADATWNTNLGVTVTRRSYVWSYPGYSDFIIYDYVFKNTGEMVSLYTSQVVPNKADFVQTLEDVYFVFNSGISV